MRARVIRRRALIGRIVANMRRLTRETERGRNPPGGEHVHSLGGVVLGERSDTPRPHAQLLLPDGSGGHCAVAR